jgi:hypothetical protein
MVQDGMIAEVAVQRAVILGLVALMFESPTAWSQHAAPQQACFFVNEFHGWKAPDARTIFIRVGAARIYRLDLAADCALLTFADAHLITKTRGSETVCSALDWDLRVSQPPGTGAPEACIVKKMTLLSPDQAAAIPPKFRP